jgi:hypothetical protein
MLNVKNLQEEKRRNEEEQRKNEPWRGGRFYTAMFLMELLTKNRIIFFLGSGIKFHQ